MTKLFESYDLAGTKLSNRIAMAPMTRARAPDDIADERVALYYAQRATAGLIVSEGTPISREGQGYLFNPGIYTPEQIEGWRLTTNSVHALGGKIVAQLWHVGRMSHPSIQHDGRTPVSASSKQPANAKAFGYNEEGQPGMVDAPAPRQLSTEEVARVVNDFAQAAQNAIDAGFDGVEIHGANGYLHEQFLNPLVNDRSDQYSAATLENRIRFTLEVIDAIVARIGADRTGIRLSPYGNIFDMPAYPQTDETYTALADAIGKRKLGFVHLMNQAGYSSSAPSQAGFNNLLKTIRSKLPETTLILAGGLDRESAETLIEDGLIDMAGFGVPFISNPDLVERLRHGHPLAKADPSTFYGGTSKGYIDYPPYNAAA
ncbi:alkene reductase [Stenotrophomonas pigmentata]|uniref:alkene reductase n=1 Tax=Stenotrophomonas pigmentata TaxID=3055080 RepID=UPI0026F1395E|nr:alkene reductase [Stenotrophomonas sp. 610A2]